MNEPKQKSPAVKPPGLLDTVFSVMASFFGVQSHENRVRDFSAGKPMVFIVVAIVMTLVIVASLWAGVHVLLKQVGM